MNSQCSLRYATSHLYYINLMQDAGEGQLFLILWISVAEFSMG